MEKISVIKRAMDLMPQSLKDEFAAHPQYYVLSALLVLLVVAVLIFLYVLIFIGLTKINGRVFDRIEKKRGRSLKYQILKQIINVIIFVIIIVIPLGGDRIGTSLLGSTAVIAAILGFAGQDILKDVLSGLLISIYKPFDIGDRIELEDGTVGIVETMTMRHIVVIRIDTLRQIIPNSKVNNMSVVNYSYGYVHRSQIFKFPVGYDVDIEKTKRVILEAVKSSAYSRPDKIMKDGRRDYAPVYFVEIADSAIMMSTTVYYDSSSASEVVRDDINTRVFEALSANGIEIPYNYMTIVMKEDKKTEDK